MQPRQTNDQDFIFRSAGNGCVIGKVLRVAALL
jgi:hypothetical protein